MLLDQGGVGLEVLGEDTHARQTTLATVVGRHSDQRRDAASSRRERCPRAAILVDARSSFPTALGWELKPEGLCRDDVCVPVREPADLFVGEASSTSRPWATALGRPVVVDADAAARRGRARRRGTASARSTTWSRPPFTLPDLDGNLHTLEEWRDQKKLLVAFASW